MNFLKQLLYITYDGLTDPLGQSQVLPYLQGLSAAGYSITVLSCEKKNRLAQSKNEIQELCSESNIEWHYIPFTTRPPLIAKAIDLYRLKKKALSLYAKKKFSWIHCRSYIASTIGLRLKRKFGTGFLFDMRDFWIDEKIDDGSWNLNNPVYRFIHWRYRKLEKNFFKHADAIVCLTAAARHEIIKKEYISGHSEKIFVIPCCADLDLFKPGSAFYPQPPVLCYLGSIGNGARYLLPQMLEFYKMAKTRIPDLQFLILSQDSSGNIQKFLDDAGVDMASVQIKSAKRAELPSVLAQVSYGIFFYKPTFARKSTSPVKLGEMLGMGIPVVCNKGIGDLDDILSLSGAGISISGFTSEEYSKAIELLRLIKPDKNLVRHAAEEHFSLAQGIEKYKVIYKKLATSY